MAITKDESLAQKGLVRIVSLEHAILSSDFLIDSGHVSTSHCVAYPITKKAHITHDLLSLYGTHWRYFVDISEGEKGYISRCDGDSRHVIECKKYSKGIPRCAKYAFTRIGLERNRNLWVFMPDTEGWTFLKRILLPVYENDLKAYAEEKEAIKSTRSQRVQ